MKNYQRLYEEDFKSRQKKATIKLVVGTLLIVVMATITQIL